MSPSLREKPAGRPKKFVHETPRLLRFARHDRNLKCSSSLNKPRLLRAAVEHRATLAAVGVVLYVHPFQPRRRRLATLGVCCAARRSIAVGNILIFTLEERFPPGTRARGFAPAGIVVLGGAISPTSSAARGTPALKSRPTESLTAVAEIAANIRRRPSSKRRQCEPLLTGGTEASLRSACRRASVYSAGPPRCRGQVRATRSRKAVFSKGWRNPPKPGERLAAVT